MALLTQYAGFFVSPFGEKSVTDELNSFLRSHRIVNVDKKLIERKRHRLDFPLWGGLK
jgi:hypothetical protein